jgi:hypothetical protein
VQSIDIDGRGRAGNLLEIGAGGTIAVWVRGGAVRINGTVVDSERHAVPSAVVVLMGDADSTLSRTADSSEYSPILCDQSGAFSVSGFAPGRYRLKAFRSVSGALLADPSAMAGLMQDAYTFEVKQGETKDAQLIAN